ncbi:MAG: imidazoleglycerol-phosphate dehydratase HisB [Clostridia bacterium]|nr:imidazoleglycerol-phosphate dehydratase HisB [Clostridia bacterium]
MKGPAKRSASLVRETAETKIELSVTLDGTGASEINTGVGFFDHMLTLFAKHSLMDLKVLCKGDTYVDAHHSVEDVGICLGKALAQALGDRAGICRYGSALLPMDETLIQTAADISGRGGLYWDVDIPALSVGNFDTELGQEFFEALCREAGITLHVRKICGTNSHHILEGCFKSAARTLRQAVSIDPALGGAVPSTKGVL